MPGGDKVESTLERVCTWFVCCCFCLVQEQLDELTEDVDEKNDQLRTASEKLASVELSLASQV